MNKNFLLLCATLAVLAAFYIFLELLIKNNQSQQRKHVFDMSVYTHDGIKITRGPGTLKLITDPFTGFKNFPNQKTRWFNISSDGFRGREINKKTNRRGRIIVTGGSAAFGTGVHSDNETFQVFLQKLNDKYEVINAGIPGFLSGQELTYIVTDIADYQPDIIMSFSGFNDLDSQWHHQFFFGKPKKVKELGYNGNFYFIQIEKALINNFRAENYVLYSFRRFLGTLIGKSSLLELLKHNIEIVKSTRRNSVAKNNSFAAPGADVHKTSYFADIVNNFTGNLIKMNDFCRCRNIIFIAVLQPELGNKKIKTSEEEMLLESWAFGTSNYREEFPQLYTKFCEDTKQVLAAHGIPYIDINSYSEFSENQKTLFCDVVHTNKTGNMVIAEIINRSLEKLKKGDCKSFTH